MEKYYEHILSLAFFSPVIPNDSEDDEDDINHCHLLCPYSVLSPVQNLIGTKAPVGVRLAT